MPTTRVLVVDDEMMVRESVRMTLAYFGYSVETAVDASEALAKLATQQFSVVVSDWKMPGMTGDQLATRIKTQWPGVPIILLTGFPPAEKPPGIDAILIKPFSAADLRATIQALTKRQTDARTGNTL